MPDIFIYQIHYAQDQALEPGFIPLNNISNERPDWFEYWPIRRFLLEINLDENSFYGFLSPKFKHKTNLNAAATLDFVRRDGGEADVILLSPSLQWTAYHWNVFQFGNIVHPGLLHVATQFFRRIGQPTDLQTLVTHSGNEVYSNYIIAKPRFWRAWLDITEQLLAIAESETDALGGALRAPTRYRGGNSVQMKVFIMERIATWILARNSSFIVRVRDPFVTRSRIYKLPAAVVCDALKIAFVTNGQARQYRAMFDVVSKLGKLFTWQIRFWNIVGYEPIRSCLKVMRSHWEQAGRS